MFFQCECHTFQLVQGRNIPNRNTAAIAPARPLENVWSIYNERS